MSPSDLINLFSQTGTGLELGTSQRCLQLAQCWLLWDLLPGSGEGSLSNSCFCSLLATVLTQLFSGLCWKLHSLSGQG